jgi:hypothetical protein
MKLINYIPHLNLPHSPSHLPLVPLHTHFTYFTVLSLLINILVDIQRGFSMYPHHGYILLWSVQPLPLLSLIPLPPTPHFSTVFNTLLYILYLHRCYVLQYYWCFSISFPFPLSLSSIEYFHYYILFKVYILSSTLIYLFHFLFFTFTSQAAWKKQLTVWFYSYDILEKRSLYNQISGFLIFIGGNRIKEVKHHWTFSGGKIILYDAIMVGYMTLHVYQKAHRSLQHKE